MNAYEIWQTNDDRSPGNPDFLGTVRANSEDEAEGLGRELYGVPAWDRVDVYVDSEARNG